MKKRREFLTKMLAGAMVVWYDLLGEYLGWNKDTKR